MVDTPTNPDRPSSEGDPSSGATPPEDGAAPSSPPTPPPQSSPSQSSPSQSSPSPSPPARPVFELSTSGHFAAWLAGLRASRAFTTYQTGKLFLIGLQPNGRLSIFERTLERIMGLHASASTLHLSTLYQVWRFENALAPGETFDGYDAVYTPRESRVLEGVVRPMVVGFQSDEIRRYISPAPE